MMKKRCWNRPLFGMDNFEYIPGKMIDRYAMSIEQQNLKTFHHSLTAPSIATKINDQIREIQTDTGMVIIHKNWRLIMRLRAEL